MQCISYAARAIAGSDVPAKREIRVRISVPKSRCGARAASLLVIVLSMCGGCRFYSSNDHFERIEGTDEVGTSQSALSMSSDGRYLLMLTVTKPLESSPSTWSHGVQTLDLSTGAITKHLQSPNMAPKEADFVRRILRVTGFVDDFAEDGWHGNRFYFRGATRAVIDPTQVYFDVGHVVPPEDTRSSDSVERGALAGFEDEARNNGKMIDAPLMHINTTSGWDRGRFTAPANQFTRKPVIFYIGRDKSGTVYSCDGKINEVVFENRPNFLLANPTLDMIRVSPDGRYLAAVYHKKMGLPVPSLGGGYELSVTQLTGSKRTRYWRSDYFGSCVWDPTSTSLYFVSTCAGLGVYRFNVDEAPWQ